MGQFSNSFPKHFSYLCEYAFRFDLSCSFCEYPFIFHCVHCSPSCFDPESLLLAYYWLGLSWIDCISANKSFSSPKTSSRKTLHQQQAAGEAKHSAETTINFSSTHSHFSPFCPTCSDVLPHVPFVSHLLRGVSICSNFFHVFLLIPRCCHLFPLFLIFFPHLPTFLHFSLLLPRAPTCAHIFPCIPTCPQVLPPVVTSSNFSSVFLNAATSSHIFCIHSHVLASVLTCAHFFCPHFPTCSHCVPFFFYHVLLSVATCCHCFLFSPRCSHVVPLVRPFSHFFPCVSRCCHIFILRPIFSNVF